jgi:hypothetical protein
MITFKDLKFNKFENEERFGEGIYCRVFFKNGLGASIVRHKHSYGGPDGLYELAVLKKDTEDIIYDTIVTDDVEGYLTEDDVTNVLVNIQILDKVS